jgi:hypothetical protein
LIDYLLTLGLLFLLIVLSLPTILNLCKLIQQGTPHRSLPGKHKTRHPAIEPSPSHFLPTGTHQPQVVDGGAAETQPAH